MSSLAIRNMNWVVGQMEIIRDHEAERINAEKQAIRKDVMDTCQEIADRMTPAQYNAWWKSTPDNNNAFLAAAKLKLAELKAREDLGTQTIISGAEVLELPQTVNDNDYPF